MAQSFWWCGCGADKLRPQMRVFLPLRDHKQTPQDISTTSTRQQQNSRNMRRKMIIAWLCVFVGFTRCVSANWNAPPNGVLSDYDDVSGIPLEIPSTYLREDQTTVQGGRHYVWWRRVGLRSVILNIDCICFAEQRTTAIVIVRQPLLCLSVPAEGWHGMALTIIRHITIRE